MNARMQHRPMRAGLWPRLCFISIAAGCLYAQAVDEKSVQTAVELPVQPIKTSLAEAIRKFRVPDEVIRSNVRVSDDVFSRVTEFFANNPPSKLDILTYLIFTYLPRVVPSGRVPPWLLEVPPENPRRLNLVYLEDHSLSDRFTHITTVYGVTRVDLIENIVRHSLPPAGRIYPPKHRRRRTD